MAQRDLPPSGDQLGENPLIELIRRGAVLFAGATQIIPSSPA